jgi:hypothetical protein
MRALLRKLARPIVGPQLDQWHRIEADLAATKEAIAKLSERLEHIVQTAGHVDHPNISNAQLNHEIVMVRRELHLLARSTTLPAHELWRDGIPTPPAALPPRDALPCSTLCRQEDMETGWYMYWINRMVRPPRYHRKEWEFVFVAQALFERGLLTEGRSGLGFGVGREPLPALFAAHGVRVIGTDMAFDAAVASGWTLDNQHAAGKEQLRDTRICPDALFDAKVSFETFDMAKTPGHFRDMDFCWSACAFEHLGSIEAGLSFVERSLECLKPGGVAVHTSEYNLTSNSETLESGATVLFRKRDFEALIARLEAAGHHVAPLDLREGTQPVETYVDMPPYLEEPHLRLALLGYATTSIGLIITKKR